MPIDGRYYVDEYMKGDDIPACLIMKFVSWEADFLQKFRQEDQEITDEEENEGEDEMNFEPLLPPLKLKNYKEAVQFLKNLHIHFITTLEAST